MITALPPYTIIIVGKLLMVVELVVKLEGVVGCTSVDVCVMLLRFKMSAAVKQ